MGQTPQKASIALNNCQTSGPIVKLSKYSEDKALYPNGGHGSVYRIEGMPGKSNGRQSMTKIEPT